MHRIIDAVFDLFHFNFGSCADADNTDAACELREALLEFFSVVVRAALFDLSFDQLAHALLNRRFFAAAFNERRLLFFQRLLFLLYRASRL